MAGCRRHLLWSKDRTSFVSVKLDKRYRVEEVEGDSQGLVIKVGSPWGPVTVMAQAMGWISMPNQWLSKTVYYKQVSESSWRVSIKNAKHPTGCKITVTHVGGPTLSDAKDEFWTKWNSEVRDTGWHTHFKATDATYTPEG